MKQISDRDLFDVLLQRTILGLLVLLHFSCLAGSVSLVPAGSVWSYEATGRDLGTAWREVDYNDLSWPSGPAQLGYGDADEATLIPKSTPVYSTYYFRQSFEVVNPAVFTSLILRVLKDDGCVVYINGIEVARYGMPAGAVSYATWASTATEYTWELPVTLSNTLLPGKNVVAVEVHQCNATSTDISLDLELTASKPDVTVTLNSPADEATTTVPATLTATATSSTSPSFTMSFYGRPWQPAIPEFCVAVLPDIQNYTAQINGGSVAILNSQIQWIRANRQALNIVYVAQEGDLSQNGDYYESEWQNASAAIYQLDTALPELPNGIPYGLAVGNHDQYVPAGDTSPTTFFNQYFGVSHFQGRTYYGGHYANSNNNSYQLFSASGLDFIVITLEYSPTQDVLNWANTILQANQNRRAILVTHSLLETTAAWTAPGLAIYNALKSNPNLFLMLCGHNHGEARRTDTYNGNTIETVLADYQSYAGGGNGFLRLLRFSPSNNAIEFKTYSPYLNQYEVDPGSQFTLAYSMSEPAPYSLVQRNVGVPSGSQSSATWAGLAQATLYEWYVVANDGAEDRSSVARVFRTSVSQAPTVTITSPGQSTTFLDTVAAEVTIAATATAPGGSVTQVEFFTNETSLAILNEPPYQTRNTFYPGTYSLTAKVTDNTGATATAAPVLLTVDGTPASPTNLTVAAGSLGANSAYLSWSDNSSVEIDYRLLKSIDGSSFTPVMDLAANATGALVGNLNPATIYYIKVEAVNSYGVGSSSILSVETLPLPPATPTLLQVEALSSTELKATWLDRSDNETSFEIWISAGNNLYAKTATVLANTQEVTFGGLQPNTTYYVTVRAVNGGGYSESSPVPAATAAATIPPNSPTGLTANPISNTEIELRWSANSSGATGLRIERSVNETSWITVQTSAADSTTTIDTGLTSGTVYHYRVVAFNAGGDSAPCSSAAAAPFVDSYATSEALTLGTLTGSRADTVEADAVYEVLAEKLTGGKNSRTSGLDHTWTFEVPSNGSSIFYLRAYRTVNSEGDEFDIAWSTDNANFMHLITVPPAGSSSDYVSCPLPTESKGTVFIRVRDTDRTSGKTMLDSLYVDQLLIRTDVSPPGDVPPAPVQVLATGGDRAITLTWAPSPNAVNIYRSTDGADFTPVATGISAASYRDTSVENGTIYFYKLAAVNSVGEGPRSASVTATPQSPAFTLPPQNFVATAGKRKITLTWTQSLTTGLTANVIYRSSDGVAFTELANISPATTYADTVASGVTYHYRAAAVSGLGESQPGTIATATAR